MTTGMIDKQRLIFPGLAGLYETFSPASYSLMRFAAGAVLVPHGIQKIMLGVSLAPYIEKQMGLPLSDVVVLLGNICQICGRCLSRDRALHPCGGIDPLHLHGGPRYFFNRIRCFWTNKGYEYALLWCLLYLAIFFRGGGRYSVDRLLGKR